jgi:hypothetical protein
MRGDFCRNWFLIDPLHYLSSRSTFGFEPIRGDIPNRKTTPQLGESGSRQLSDSAIECLKETHKRALYRTNLAKNKLGM